MRIRKRKVPLPISLLSPIPLSDPRLFSQSPVHLHQPQPSDHSTLTSPSDLHPLILLTTPISSGVKLEDPKQGSCLEFPGEGGGRGERISQKSNNNNDDDDGSKDKEEEEKVAVDAANNNGSFDLSPSNQGGGVKAMMRRIWSDGERVIPLKKRRPSESILLNFEKKDNNYVDRSDDHHEDHHEEAIMTAGSLSHQHNNKKGGGGKQKRETTIMEGSRCSRVNGRGWRCCQPTLVGYSLCEHHLGKGRLRSMTSVRGRPSSSKKKQKQQIMPATVVNDNHHHHHDGDQKQQVASSKRLNYKLGVVKARSLSSLLGQTTNTLITTPTTSSSSNNNNNENNADRDTNISRSST